MESKRKMKERFGLRRNIFKEFLAEFLGIFVLILFGCGSVAQTVLSRGALGEPLTIHVGFTLGVMMAVYMAGGVSGAHVNPAVSLAMVILGKLPLKKFPVYVLAQFLGAFAGSCAVYGLYYDALMEYTKGEFVVTGENATANIFASYPAKHLSLLNGFVDQVIGTGALVLCILAITDRKNIGAPKEPGGAGGGSLWPGPWWAERWGPDFTSCSLICTSRSQKNRRRTKVPSKTNMKS
ncbi:aquaporin-9b isoform X2 [Takifugu rubripes]|uniref:aquaporin-9b isoform X2 n=1 Tax=Takifugu rubripes TaxID=31033 RepID=UPI0011460154|nr:aquaporin-9 isoform X2 [Takifugu rubripes]